MARKRRKQNKPAVVITVTEEQFLKTAGALRTRGTSPPYLDPERATSRAEASRNELLLARQDGTPELQKVPGVPGETWLAVIDRLLAYSHDVLGRKEARFIQAVPDSSPLMLAMEKCARVRRRVATACTGTGVLREQSADQKDHVFKDRPFPNTRAGWENELKALRANILGLGDEVPPELLPMIPMIDDAKADLDAAPLLSPGRRKPEQMQWSPEAQEAALALHLAMDRLIRCAAAHATDKRLASLQRAAGLTTPKKKGPAEKAQGKQSDGEKHDGPAAPEKKAGGTPEK